ncbi:hypothetical protein PoB_004967200 [Plakobranchus ocellatus]|uniref:Uncharacterized protein n=1 Tax=Plakobranchus ocellatus TaxID=259542 RepID=A0AAV4BVH4_9GAST|nr:hypothetical protein PoB_004967200 [Plakobranchus ocellatus]
MLVSAMFGREHKQCGDDDDDGGGGGGGGGGRVMVVMTVWCGKSNSDCINIDYCGDDGNDDDDVGGVCGSVASQSALSSAGTFLPRVRATPKAIWPDGVPESLRSPC